MSLIVEGAGVPLAVSEEGEGAPVLVVHDLAAGPPALDVPAHVISYDRRGYGDSGAPVPYEATTVHEQAEDAACVLRATTTEPAVVCGDGFGALIALDLVTRHADLVAGVVLADPPLFAFVAEAAEALSAERLLLEEALREGGPELAVERHLGPGADPASLARARAAHRAFFADLAGLTSWPVTRGTLRAVDRPVAIVTSPAAAPHVLAAADALAGLLPQARRSHDGDLATAVRTMV